VIPGDDDRPHSDERSSVSWGAVLATVLAVVKLLEVWRSRARVEVSHNFTSSPDIGNEVIIRDLAATPLLITHRELIWRHRRWFRWKQSRQMTPDNFFQDLKLDGHTSTQLTFRVEEHFDWGVDAMGRDHIYLRLHLAGRKAVVRKVFDGS